MAEHFDWVQTIDRLKIAQRLNGQISAEKKLNVCIQVNIDNDDNKAGISANELSDLAKAISELPNLTLRGLMTIPKANQSEDQQSESFAQMTALFEDIKKHYPSVDTLSMGMSGDMQNAINNGSTMVRVGSAIFGLRN